MILKEEFTKFNLEDYLTTDKLRKEYLNQVLVYGDIEEFKRALFYIAKSKPRFESIFKVVNALDIKLVYA